MSLKEIILFYRVKDWLHLLGLVVLGYAYSQSSVNALQVIAGFVVGSLYLSHGYSLNDICDNQLKTAISSKKALFLSVMVLILCLILSSLISLKVLFIVIVGHLGGMFYSAPPFRFKNKFLLDLVFNALSLAPLFLLGYAINGILVFKPLAVFFLFFVYFIPIQLVHQMQDCAIDIEYKHSNTFQILGIKKTKYLIYATLLAYTLLSLLLWRSMILNMVASLASIIFAIALFCYVHLAVKSQGKISRNLKLDTRYVSILYGVAMVLSFYSKA